MYLFLASIFLVLVAAPGESKFYKGLTMNDGFTSCCSKKDCEPTDDWRILEGGNFQIKMYGVWIEPPREVIQFLKTPDGGAHACYSKPTTNFMPYGHIEAPVNPRYWHWHCVILPLMIN